MSISLEPLMFYVGKNFYDRARKVFNLGIGRKPLLQILQKMSLQPAEMDRDEAMRALERFTRTGGVSTASKEAMKIMLVPFASFRGESISFINAYELGFGILIEILGQIRRAFRAPLFAYIWIAIPRSSEGYERMIRLLRDIRDKVGALPIDPEEWEAIQPITEKLLESGFNIKGLTENLWVSI
ncbi:MAG: hypothetical protein QXX94_06500 [Candidatus Bathyarchaeia archaeon]